VTCGGQRNRAEQLPPEPGHLETTSHHCSVFSSQPDALSLVGGNDSCDWSPLLTMTEPSKYFAFFFSDGGTGVGTQGLTLARKTLLPLEPLRGPVLCWVFLR
jgi:hypothetical protein